MNAIHQPVAERRQLALTPNRATERELRRTADPHPRKAPIVAAVEPRTAHVVGDTAARLARQLGVPLVFVTVRPRPPMVLGDPYYQRRLTRGLFRSRKALDAAIAATSRYNVASWGEILEGDAAPRIVEFAGARDARLLVIGRRRRRLRRSVSRRLIRAAGRPVVVAAKSPRIATPTRGGDLSTSVRQSGQDRLRAAR